MHEGPLNLVASQPLSGMFLMVAMTEKAKPKRLTKIQPQGIYVSAVITKNGYKVKVCFHTGPKVWLKGRKPKKFKWVITANIGKTTRQSVTSNARRHAILSIRTQLQPCGKFIFSMPSQHDLDIGHEGHLGTNKRNGTVKHSTYEVLPFQWKHSLSAYKGLKLVRSRLCLLKSLKVKSNSMAELTIYDFLLVHNTI